MSKFLRVVGIGCGGCLVILIAVGLIGYSMLPTEMHVERSRTIAAPIEVVFPMVDTLETWEDWDPWSQLDPEMERSYEGPPSGEGALLRWSSESPDVGKGWLKITESVIGERIVFELHIMFGEDDMPATGTFDFETLPEGVRVTWSDDAQLEGINRFMGLLGDFMLGPTFDKGLRGLEELAEKRAAALKAGALPNKGEVKGAIKEAVDGVLEELETGTHKGN